MLKKARFNEVLEQYSAHLPVEACHLRGASGGELCAGVHEQMPDTGERFFDTSCLEWLRHMRCSSQLLAIWAFGERDRTPCKMRGEQSWRLHSRITAPRRAGVLMKADARQA
jgi:hypothetical protein